MTSLSLLSRMSLPVLVFLACSAAAYAQVDMPFLVADKTGQVDTLRWGFFPGATAGRDAAFDEVEFPPPPPSFLFDARWVGPKEFGEGTRRDYRAPSSPLDTFVLKVQPNEGGYPVFLGWPELAGHFQSASLRFVSTEGAITTVDMLKEGSTTIVNSDPVSLVTIVAQRFSAPR